MPSYWDNEKNDRVTPPAERLRDCAKALHAAVVTLPFDIMTGLPKNAERAKAYIDSCRDWHDKAVERFNRAAESVGENIDGTWYGRHPSSHGLPAVHSLVGIPEFAESDYRTGGSKSFMETFNARHSRRVEKAIEQVRRATLNMTSGQSEQMQASGRDLIAIWEKTRNEPMLPFTARELVLDLRLRSLDFVEWLERAATRFETALLPRFWVGATVLKHGKHELKVELGGRVELRRVQGKTALILRELNESGQWEFTHTKELSRFVSATEVPELAQHLKTVSGRGKGKTIRALPASIRERIELESNPNGKTSRNSGRKS